MAGTLTHEHEAVLNGRHVRQGDKLAFRGMVGEFSFHCLTTNENTGRSWITCLGGRDGVNMFRSFSLDDLKPVESDAA